MDAAGSACISSPAVIQSYCATRNYCYKADPFGQLHAHLSGSISRECLHEIWLQKKERGETALEDPLAEMPAGKFDYDLDT